jgi:alpha-glucosidase (family GH31 glycosyl hydrolase)
LGETVLASAKINLKLRYSLLKYFYYLFVNKKGLGTIWRPLFFEFPQDTNTYVDDIADTQFLIGPNLMSAPILEPGVTQRKAYFPEFNWYNLETGEKYVPGTEVIKGVGLTNQVPLFIR